MFFDFKEKVVNTKTSFPHYDHDQCIPKWENYLGLSEPRTKNDVVYSVHLASLHKFTDALS